MEKFNSRSPTKSNSSPIVAHKILNSSLPEQAVESGLIVNHQYSELEHVPQAGSGRGQQGGNGYYGKTEESKGFHELPERGPDRNLAHSSNASERKLCGIGLITFLTIIIAVLSAAVIGLVAATAVEANKLSKATSCASGAANSSSPVPTPSISNPTDLPVNATRGACEKSSGTLDYLAVGTTQKFKLFCNSDILGSDHLTITSPSFEACIEGCADWNRRVDHKQIDGPICTAVGFVPSWYNSTGPRAGVSLRQSLTGDCFLKHLVGVGNLTSATGQIVDAAIAIF